MLRPGGVVLNFAREGIVDEAAVLAALDAGTLRAYVSDFPNNLTKSHPKCVTLPHLGASTAEAEDKLRRALSSPKSGLSRERQRARTR
jgi:D-3-phosphoglycerate dehydrogenase